MWIMWSDFKRIREEMGRLLVGCELGAFLAIVQCHLSHHCCFISQ